MLGVRVSEVSRRLLQQLLPLSRQECCDGCCQRCGRPVGGQCRIRQAGLHHRFRVAAVWLDANLDSKYMHSALNLVSNALLQSSRPLPIKDVKRVNGHGANSDLDQDLANHVMAHLVASSTS